MPELDLTYKINIPFAQNGDKDEIPDTSAEGLVNNTDGLGVKYETPIGQGGEYYTREIINGALYKVYAAVKEIQEIAETAGFPVDMANALNVLPIANGGTGANNATQARSNLGLGSLATKSSITSADITDSTITSNDIANNAVTNTKINDGAVTTSKIADTAVTANKLASSAVTNAKIANNTITAAKLVNKTITATQIADNTITATQLAANSVGASELANNAVDNAAIVNGAVTDSKIADGAVTQAKLAANVIGNLPVGFVYIQFRGQSTPDQLFGTSGKWQDISSTYAGRFFRAAGGAAAGYGSLQAGGVPNITGLITTADLNAWVSSSYSGALSTDNQSGYTNRGGESWATTIATNIRLNASSSNSLYGAATEVRPVNETIRVWKK